MPSSNINPKRKVDTLEEILGKFNKINDFTGQQSTEEEQKRIVEEFEAIGKEVEIEETPGFWKTLKEYAAKVVENTNIKADLKRIKQAEDFRASKNIPNNQYIPLGLSYQLKREQDVREKVGGVVALGVAGTTVAGLAIHMPGPTEEPPADPVEKVTYLQNGANDTAKLVDIDSNPITFDLSGDNVLAFTAIDAKALDLTEHFIQFDGGVDQAESKITFDSEGGADVYITGVNTNNSVIMELTYQEALQQLPLLIDGIDQIEIRTKAYTEPGSNPVYRNVNGDEIVNKTLALLGIDADPANYRMNVTSTFDHANKTAIHGVKFIAESDDVSDIMQTGLSAEVMAQVNDILIDNHAGDDYDNMLETIKIWEGVHEVLSPIINDYTNELITVTNELTAQRDQNNSALQELTVHYTNILNNLTKIGYIDKTNYSSVEDAVADITTIAEGILAQDFSIADKSVFRTVYDSLPAEYQQFLIDDPAKLNDLLDGTEDNGEFLGFNLSIEGKVTEENNSYVVNVTGTSLFDAVGSEDDYAVAGIPREAVQRIILETYKARGVHSTVPTERTLDKNAANMLYIGLGNLDQQNIDAGTPTDYQAQFMSQSDHTKLFNDDNSDEELGNVTLEIYQAADASVGVIYDKIQADGSVKPVRAPKSNEWLQAAYKIIGE